MQTSKRLGMVTLNDALIELVDAGQVEPKEAYMKANDKTGLRATCCAIAGIEVERSSTPRRSRRRRAAHRRQAGGSQGKAKIGAR